MILLLLILTFLITPNAYAYLDAGVGTMIVQGVVAVIATLLVYGKVIMSKIKHILNKNKAQDSVEENDSSVD